MSSEETAMPYERGPERRKLSERPIFVLPDEATKALTVIVVLEYCLGNALGLTLVNFDALNPNVLEASVEKSVMQIIVFAGNEALIETT
jgi:hypothetical protein